MRVRKLFVARNAIEACQYALIIFIGVTGTVGMILVYCPDEVIKTVYRAGLYSGLAAGVIKYLGTVLR